MSGHSKWHSIKHKKGAADAKRGKIFTVHAKLISVAARNGGDPNMNPSLRLAIDNAKKANVPSTNIERAIKRGTGELKDEAQIEEVIYEGYGPCGTAVIVECLTDNKNRSYTNVRTIFTKKGGNLGTSGSVMWMFERKGVIELDLEGKNADEVELAAIDAGAEDLESGQESVTVYTPPDQLTEVNQKLKAAGLSAQKAEVSLVAQNTVPIETEEDVKKVLDFLEALEEDEDVSGVHSNADIPEDMIEKIMQ